MLSPTFVNRFITNQACGNHFMNLRSFLIAVSILLLPLLSTSAAVPSNWASGDYAVGSLVIHEGTTYIATQAVNSSQGDPKTTTAYWSSLDALAGGMSTPTGQPTSTPDASSLSGLSVPSDANETGATDDPDLPNAGSTDVVLRGISTAGYISDTSKLSGGFTISGGSMTVLATGKGGKELLSTGSLQDTLSNPQMVIKNLLTGADLHSNSDWSTGDHVAELTSTAFFNNYESDDAGLYVTLDAGSYLADISSSDGDSGGAILELYDGYGFWNFVNTGAKLTGISTNGIVQPGTEPGQRMSAALNIGNFGQDAAATKRMIIMAKYSLGVTSDWLEDPRLEVRNASGAVIASNDDWSSNKESVKTVITATGLMNGYRDKDAALILNVTPGNYYMDVYSQDGDSGGSLVEVYDLDLLESIYSWTLGN
jgi:hypothetical protein